MFRYIIAYILGGILTSIYYTYLDYRDVHCIDVKLDIETYFELHFWWVECLFICGVWPIYLIMVLVLRGIPRSYMYVIKLLDQIFGGDD